MVKIGEVIKIEGKSYKVCDSKKDGIDSGCKDCAFFYLQCWDLKRPSCYDRSSDFIFKLVNQPKGINK